MFWDLPEFFWRECPQKTQCSHMGDKIPRFVGLYLEVSPFGGSPLWWKLVGGPMVGGSPHKWWRSVGRGPTWGQPSPWGAMDKGGAPWGASSPLLWGNVGKGPPFWEAISLPPPPLPHYIEGERCSPNTTQLEPLSSHKMACNDLPSLSLATARNSFVAPQGCLVSGSN